MDIRIIRPAIDECIPYYFTYIDLVPDGDIIGTLQTQHTQIHSLLRGMSEAKAAASPAPGEWSTKQVLLHVIDTERLFSFRTLWFARGEETVLPGMEPNPWVAVAHANAREVGDLLGEFDHVRAATYRLVSQPRCRRVATPRQGERR